MADPRREFKLPAGDTEYLDGLGLTWEAIKQPPNGTQQWLLIHDWKIPEDYNINSATAALIIDPQYSDTQIDSVYFFPTLKRKDGVAINNVAGETDLDGRKFQFWSRHRTQQNAWKPGVDDVASHLALVTEWLKREFNK